MFACRMAAVSRSSGANNQRPTAIGARPMIAYAASRTSPARRVFAGTGPRWSCKPCTAAYPAATTQPSIKMAATALLDS